MVSARQPRTARRQAPPDPPGREPDPNSGALDLPDISEEPINDALVPIGSSGFYQSPVEPVDPRDCDRWPESPYCGSSGLNTDGFIDLVPEITYSECEVCITISPTLAFISLPPYTVCYRRDSPGCKPPPPPPQPIPPQEIVQGANFDTSKQCHCHVYRITYELVFQTAVMGGGGTFLSPISRVGIKEGFHQNTYLSGEQPDYFDEINGTKYAFVQSQMIGHFARFSDCSAEPILFGENLNGFLGFRNIQINYDPDADRDFYQRQGASWIACELEPGVATGKQKKPPKDPPQPPPKKRCCMSCCNNNNSQQTDLLRLIAKRLGTSDYPASVPVSLLTDRGKGQQTIESLTQLTGWFIQQMDALVGEFPINIQIEDTDPTKKGNQSQKVKIPNLAEAIADLYALALKNSVDSDSAISFLMRLASETIATKNSSLITQDYARANAEFLGYKGNNIKRDISYAFDPEGLASLETILRESNKQIVGWEIEETDSLLDYQKRLMFSAGIIKAVFFRGQKNTAQLNREVNNLVNKSEGEDTEERWREFLRALNNPNHRFNVGDSPNPEIKDLSVPQDISQLKEDKK